MGCSGMLADVDLTDATAPAVEAVQMAQWSGEACAAFVVVTTNCGLVFTEQNSDEVQTWFQNGVISCLPAK